MSTNILSFKIGVTNPEGGHNNSVCLVSDGEVLIAVETERFTRNKHGGMEFPGRIIEFVLNQAGVELSDLSAVAIPYEPALEARRAKAFFTNIVESEIEGGISEQECLSELRDVVDHYDDFRFNLESIVREKLHEIDDQVPEIVTNGHHRSHAASAFYPSGFDESIVLTMDAMGEVESTVVWHGTQSGIEKLRSYDAPNSLGAFYATVTRMLGYDPIYDEGKVMGLAAYGSPNEDIRTKLHELITPGVEYDVSDLMATMSTNRAVKRLETLFGRERKEDSTNHFTQWEKDLAFEAQRFLETTVTSIVREYQDRLGTDNVALAGGVALNCKLNKAVCELPCIENVFIQPAAHDAGTALGAALLEFDVQDVPRMDTVYLGPEYSDSYCESVLRERKIPYREERDIAKRVAEELADGKIVGWFQGRTEFGPRALGNRSILADPRDDTARDRINESVKHREPWRPFAPSIIEEDAEKYLKTVTEAPFMTKTSDTYEDTREEIEAVIHPGDATTRPQVVSEELNPRYHRVISEFKELTGTGVVLNTSFNDSGEPIVNRPAEAIADFYSTGIDTLAISNYLIIK